MGPFFAELSRRHVFRVAGIYAMTAWVVLQAVDVLSESLELPDWVDGFFAVALIAGFPIAIVLAWAFELTPDGIQVTAPGPRRLDDHEAGDRPAIRRLDGLLAVGIATIGVLAAWQTFAPAEQREHSSGAANRASMIAVLPFTDLSDTADQGYFADGLSEELLNVLAGVPGLGVVSRTSAFSFKGQGREVTEIARLLGVDHLLEGSVRKAGNRLRINAQLVRGEDGLTVWSDTYDRQLDDVFAVQEDIANRVLHELQVKVMGEAVRVEVARADAIAHDLVARALQVRRATEPTAHRFAQEESLLRQALEVDPGYAPAMFRLAQTLGTATVFVDMAAELAAANLREGRRLIDRGLEFDPDSPLGVLTRATYLAAAGDSADLEEAETLFLRAQELQPNIEISDNYAWVFDRQERWDEWLAFQRQQARFNPRSVPARSWLIRLLLSTGRMQEADEQIARLAREFPEGRGRYEARWLRIEYNDSTGARARAVGALQESLSESDNELDAERNWLAWEWLAMHEYERATGVAARQTYRLFAEGLAGTTGAAYQELKEALKTTVHAARNEAGNDAYLTILLAYLGGDTAYIAELASQWPSRSTHDRACREEAFPHAVVVYAYRDLENAAAAESLMSCFRDWLSLREANSVDDPREWFRRGDYHAMAGEADAAFAAYEHMFSTGYFGGEIPFEEWPAVRALEGDPRHGALVRRYYRLLNEQRRLLGLSPVRAGERAAAWTVTEP